MVNHGYHNDVMNISEIPEDKYEDLEYVYNGRRFNLPLSAFSHLCIWTTYCKELAINKIMIDVNGVATIPYEEFQSFRQIVFPVKYSGPIPPGPNAKWSSQKPTTLANNFKRGIKQQLQARH